MGSIFLNKSMPFYQFGDLIALKKISVDDWADYICQHFADGHRTISKNQAARIAMLVDCYSAYVQQLAWIIYSQTKEGCVITDEQIASGFNDLLAINDVLFIQAVEPLTEYQMNFLRAVASGVNKDFTLEDIRQQYHLGSYSTIPRLKTALINAGLIDSSPQTGITITDPVFEQWIRRKMM